MSGTVTHTAGGWAKPTNLPADIRVFAQFKVITVAVDDERWEWTNTGSARAGIGAIAWIPDAAPLPRAFVYPRVTRLRVDGF